MESKIKEFERQYDENMRVFIEDVEQRLNAEVDSYIKEETDRMMKRQGSITERYGL